jgi:hypothetical protein
MASDFDLTDDDLKTFEAEDLVKKTNNADDLVHLVVEDEHHPVARTAAAEKLLKMWEDGRQGGITLDHLAYVGDHAGEPYKSRANQIIRDNL